MPIKINAFRNQFYYIMPTFEILKVNAIIVYRCLNNVKVLFSKHSQILELNMTRISNLPFCYILVLGLFKYKFCAGRRLLNFLQELRLCNYACAIFLQTFLHT